LCLLASFLKLKKNKLANFSYLPQTTEKWRRVVSMDIIILLIRTENSEQALIYKYFSSL